MALINPIKDLSASEVIALFESGAEYRLDKLREKAIYLIAVHLAETNEPTIRSALNALLESKDLEGFVSVAAKWFLPGVDGWQHKEIR